MYYLSPLPIRSPDEQRSFAYHDHGGELQSSYMQRCKLKVERGARNKLARRSRRVNRNG